MESCTFIPDLEDKFISAIIDERSCVVYPAGDWRRSKAGRSGRCGEVGRRGGRRVTDDGDAGLPDVFETEGYFVAVALEVECYAVTDKFLL